MAAKQVASRIKVEMLFDIISPYAYIQLELLRRNRLNWPTMQLELKPVFLSGIIVGSGNRAPFQCKKKGDYILEDLKMLASTFKIPLIMPESFFEKAVSKTSLPVQRFLVSIEPKLSPELFEQLVLHLYRAHFSPNSVDLRSTDVISALTIEAGVDAQTVKNAIDSMNSDENKNNLKTVTEQALERGVFGVPTMFVHGPTGPRMVWGSDRMFVIGNLLGEKKPPVFY